MEWYTYFNYSNLGNNSGYDIGNVGAWSYSTAEYRFGYGSLFRTTSPDLLSAVFAELFKSSIITLITLAGLTRIKPKNFKSHVIYLIDTLMVLLVALSFYTLISIFLFPFVIYRLLVQFYFVLNKPSCRLMHGTDAFWCMDDQGAKSIINIMILLEVRNKDEDLLRSLTNLMMRLCLDPVYGYKFSSYHKKSNSGYFYWKKGDLREVKTHLSYITDRISNENDLKIFLSGVANKPITGFGWEVLVSQTDLDKTKLRPVVFRMHHSIGDGVSILSALMTTISDRTNAKFTLSQTLNVSFQPNGTDFRFTVPTFEPLDVKINRILTTLKSNIYKIPAYIHGPLNLIRHGLAREEKFQFSVEQLSGKKLITWYNDKKILNNIKDIKRGFNSSFTDIVIALLSNSVNRYLEKRGTIPREMTVVVPIYGGIQKGLKIKSEITREGNNIKVSRLEETNIGMENSFWVAMLPIPLKENGEKTLRTRIDSVKQNTETLRKSPDFIMHSFLLSVIVTLVPEELVRPMFNIVKSHLVYTNLPGPQDEIKIAGNILKQMTFWPPNRGTTGLGLSLLSNNKKLSIGLIADSAVIPTQQDLQSILDDLVDSVHKESALSQ